MIVKNIGKRYHAALLWCKGMFDDGLETLLLLFPGGMFGGGIFGGGIFGGGIFGGVEILLSHVIVPSAGIITSESILTAKFGFFVPHFLQNLSSTLIWFWQLVQCDIGCHMVFSYTNLAVFFVYEKNNLFH